jgi:cysteine desulfurase
MRAYLDHASSAPLRPAVVDAMIPFLRDHPADPGRLHEEGRVTRVAVEAAREQVAALVGARPREVVFTSSGTEAVNHAIAGAVARAGGGHIVTTAVEHSAVLESCRRASPDVTLVGADRLGRWSPDAVLDAFRPDTVLVSVQTANHEVGTIQPVEQVVDGCRERGALLHVDACASFGHAALAFDALGADLCSITAHKVGGPKGAAALLVRRGLRIPSLVLGGAQERARRGGIENVAAIAGFGRLCELLVGDGVMDAEIDAARRHIAVAAEVTRSVPGVQRFGDPNASIPNLLCIGVDGVEAEPILLALDQHGIAVHSGSSCSSEMLEPSPVLEAMGVDAEHSLRLSVGWSTTDADVRAFADALPGIVERMRALRADLAGGAGT